MSGTFMFDEDVFHVIHTSCVCYWREVTRHCLQWRNEPAQWSPLPLCMLQHHSVVTLWTDRRQRVHSQIRFLLEKNHIERLIQQTCGMISVRAGGNEWMSWVIEGEANSMVEFGKDRQGKLTLFRQENHLFGVMKKSERWGVHVIN